MAITLSRLLDLDGEAARSFERYVVDGYLGEGGEAKVLLGRDERLGRDVAVKLRVGASRASEDEAMRFHREAKALAQVEHPNILRVVDYSGPACRTPFLIVERLTGVDLDTLVKGQPLQEREVCAVGYMLAQAIAAVHARGIIHRDIKPGNVMLTDDGRVVLIDFGFCKGLHTDAVAAGETFVDKPTRCVGTPAFASPEQLRGLHLSPATDLFSLASTLYFIASEVLPFRGDSLRSTMMAIMRDDPFPIQQLIDCSRELPALLAALFVKDPVTRGAVDAQRLLFQLSKRGGAIVTEVCKELARARGVRGPAARDVDDDGNNLSDLREMFLSSGSLSFDELTQWTVRHSPPDKSQPKTEQLRARDREETTMRDPVRAKEVRRVLEQVRGRGTSRVVIGALFVFAIVIGFALARLTERRPPPPPVATPPAVVDAPLTAPVSPPAPNEVGRLRIAVKPWGKVTIDGVVRGVTPELRTVDLPSGPHVVVVEHPKHGRAERVVDVGPGETLAVFELLTR